MAIVLERYIRTKIPTNLRKGPSTESEIIGLKGAGFIARIVTEGPGTWYKIVTPQGNLGYMSSKPEYTELYEPGWLAKARQILEFGNTYLGKPYVWGSNRSTDPDFDCSDFVQWCYKKVLGISLPWDSYSQSKLDKFKEVPLTDLRPGDVVFFDTNGDKRVNHVALFGGSDRLLHTYNTKCSIYDSKLALVRSGGGGVTWTKFSGHWQSQAVSAKRIIED